MRSNQNKWSIIALLISFIAFSAGSSLWRIEIANASIQSSFPDVKNDDVHLGSIEYLKAQGVLGGYPDGTFKPEKTINRAEALKLVFLARQKLMTDDNSTLKTIDFGDVKSGDWYYDSVKKAFSLGIVNGYTDGTFKPANEITAAESLKIVVLTLVKGYQEKAAATDPFNDIKKDQWVASFASYAKSRQLIEASGNADLTDGNFGPDRKMSRAEFAEMLYRTLFVEQNKLDNFPISTNWKACNNYQLDYLLKYPNGWQKILAGDQMIFWKKDLANAQVSFARIYPNSAVIIVAVDTNPQKLSLQKYLDTLEYGQGSNKQVITLNGLPYASIFVEQSGLQDSYFEMPNGEILVIYAQVGDGALSSQLKEEVRYVIGSVRESRSASSDAVENCMDTKASGSMNLSVPNVPASVSPNTGSAENDKIISAINSKVLITGMAQDALDKIDDEIIISTDSIGIGTGPVDYYYSLKLDLTLKVDRNAKTILASKKGRSSAF